MNCNINWCPADRHESVSQLENLVFKVWVRNNFFVRRTSEVRRKTCAQRVGKAYFADNYRVNPLYQCNGSDRAGGGAGRALASPLFCPVKTKLKARFKKWQSLATSVGYSAWPIQFQFDVYDQCMYVEEPNIEFSFCQFWLILNILICLPPPALDKNHIKITIMPSIAIENIYIIYILRILIYNGID